MGWLLNNPAEAWQLTVQHIWLALLPTVFGLIIALPIGMFAEGRPHMQRAAVIGSNVTFTIPSLALFVTIPALIGTKMLDPINIVIALTLYSAALLTRSVIDALAAVPHDVQFSAEAMGISRLGRRLRVDLPLALPVLTAGVRVVQVTNISLVSVGAVIGVGGLGRLFTAGYQRDYPEQIFAGIVLILLLALVFDRLLALVGRVLTPWHEVGAQGAN